MLDRSIKECFGQRKFGKAQMQEVADFFEMDVLECVYCGSSHVSRWDHLYPVTNGGDTVLGNMVPACCKCDDSKRDRPFEEFLLNHSALSLSGDDRQERISRLKRYVLHFQYAPCPLEEKLDSEEIQELRAIQEDTQKLRSRLDSLIGQHRSRAGKT